MSKYQHLFSPIKIGTMEVKNRLVVPAMGTNLAESSHEAGEALIRYYTERAKGGFGLIITECTAIAQEGSSLVNECAIWDDSFIPSYQKLTAAVQAAGAKSAVSCATRAGRPSQNTPAAKKSLLPPPYPALPARVCPGR